jgi:uncharacterized protein (TIGR04255 family)
MAKHRHLNNAPIREAVIDIRAGVKVELKEGELLSLKAALGKRYPNSEEMRIFRGGFGVKEGKPIVDYPKDMGINGYLFKSDDEKNIVQFRNDGFTFNRIKPYTSWDKVIREAKDLWGLYVDKAGVQSVSRIAVRYINQIDIPLPISDFEDYLTKPPDVPEGVPKIVRSFLCRVVVHDIEKDIAANVSQALGPSIKPSCANIILDIDVYKDVDIQYDNYENIWKIFEQLHELKNNIFFSSITEKTARLFE